jgi:regulator of sirC expression with transglutaminase-like and TPR domain
MEPLARFAAAVGRVDAAVPLDEAALCIAAHAQPGLDVDAQLARLDRLADSCRVATLDGLVDHLFGPGRFAGNTVDYDDPRNSFLDAVLDRRLGLPITLCVLAMEVGRRIGVPIDGVGMPGHFLLRDKVDRSVFVDPFHGGKFLDVDGCRRLFHAAVGADAPWNEGYLQPSSRVAIVDRMLLNLKQSYERRRDEAAQRWVMKLRCRLPNATPADRAELARLMAPLN